MHLISVEEKQLNQFSIVILSGVGILAYGLGWILLLKSELFYLDCI